MTREEKSAMSVGRRRNRRRYYAYEIGSTFVYGLLLFLVCLAVIFFVLL